MDHRHSFLTASLYASALYLYRRWRQPRSSHRPEPAPTGA